MFRVVHILDSLNQGGRQRQVLEACKFLNQAGAKTAVVYYQADEFMKRDFVNAGVEVYRIERSSNHDPGFVKRLRRFVYEFGADIVHAHLVGPSCWAAIAFGWDSNIKLVVQEASAPQLEPIKLRLLRAIAYMGSDIVVANAYARVPALVERYAIPKENIVVIPNGIDTTVFRPLTTEERVLARKQFYGSRVDGLIFGYAGAMHRRKSPQNLVKAVAALPSQLKQKITIAWAGQCFDEKLHQQVKQIAASAGIYWKEVGRLTSSEQMVKFYNSLDWFVLPSSGEEGVPNVLLEALACGVPCISTSIGDTPLLVIDQVTGWLVLPNDVESLKEGIVKAARCPHNIRLKMANAGRHHIEQHYSLPRYGNRLLTLYHSLLEPKQE